MASARTWTLRRSILRGWPEAVTPTTVLVALGVVAGLVLRVWVLAGPLGSLDADEAITGLMARHALHGEIKVFYWLSYYGGSQESLLTAAVFAVTGSSVLVLKLVALGLFIVGGIVLWRIGVRTIGERAALFALVLYWISPAYFVWWTTKSRGYYATGLICELVVILIALRLRERESRRDAAALGFTLGFGVWATLQSLLGALPALVWLVWRRPSVVRQAWLVAPAFVVGAAPWLWWNARHDWIGLIPKAAAAEDTTYFGRLWDFVSTVLPTWLGLRVPFSLDWLTGAILGTAIVVAALAGFVLLLVRRPPRLEAVLVVGALFPFLYASTSYTYFVDEPRYLVYLAPITTLLLGRLAAARFAMAVVVLGAAIALSIAGLGRMEQQGFYRPGIAEGRVPNDMGPLIRTLEAHGADRVLASYWIAYRLSFESRERIIATSTGFSRYPRWDRLVRESPHPSYVFVADSSKDHRARAQLTAQGYQRYRAGDFAAYIYP